MEIQEVDKFYHKVTETQRTSRLSLRGANRLRGEAEANSKIPRFAWNRLRNLVRAVPNYKNKALEIIFTISRYPERTFGERMRKARLERGLTQEQLAKLLGVNEMTVIGWEKDRREPIKSNKDTIMKILDIEK